MPPCSAEILIRLCPSSRIRLPSVFFHTTSGSRMPSITQFVSSWLYSSSDSGGIRLLNSSSIVIVCFSPFLPLCKSYMNLIRIFGQKNFRQRHAKMLCHCNNFADRNARNIFFPCTICLRAYSKGFCCLCLRLVFPCPQFFQ